MDPLLGSTLAPVYGPELGSAIAILFYPIAFLSTPFFTAIWLVIGSNYDISIIITDISSIITSSSSIIPNHLYLASSANKCEIVVILGRTVFPWL